MPNQSSEVPVDIFRPKRVDIFKDENILFDDGGFEGDLIIKPQKEDDLRD
jgi:hypothetical protein